MTYQALCGRRPFVGDEAETIVAIQRLNPTPVSSVNPNMNYGISQVRELLEGARRFFAATEYTLAEIKIDEALDLDPKNAETLQLRGELEKGRSDSKAAESIAQVRHHLEGRALPQARETLEKLLGQRPNDPDAL